MRSYKSHFDFHNLLYTPSSLPIQLVYLKDFPIRCSQKGHGVPVLHGHGDGREVHPFLLQHWLLYNAVPAAQKVRQVLEATGEVFACVLIRNGNTE